MGAVSKPTLSSSVAQRKVSNTELMSRPSATFNRGRALCWVPCAPAVDRYSKTLPQFAEPWARSRA